MKKSLLIVLTVTLLLAGVAPAAYIKYRTVPVISKDIQKKVGFTIFVPNKSDHAWTIDSKKINYDEKIGVLYTTLYKAGTSNRITMTQQVLPSPFSDIPNYSAVFLGKLNQYSELNVAIGTVALTRPTELKGGQSAVLNVRGTLMFLHPDQNLGEDIWKDVFTTLQAL